MDDLDLNNYSEKTEWTKCNVSCLDLSHTIVDKYFLLGLNDEEVDGNNILYYKI